MSCGGRMASEKDGGKNGGVAARAGSIRDHATTRLVLASPWPGGPSGSSSSGGSSGSSGSGAPVGAAGGRSDSVGGASPERGPGDSSRAAACRGAWPWRCRSVDLSALLTHIRSLLCLSAQAEFCDNDHGLRPWGSSVVTSGRDKARGSRGSVRGARRRFCGAVPCVCVNELAGRRRHEVRWG